MVDLARTLSDTFAGIAPGSVPAFVLAQLAGGLLGVGLVAVLYPGVREAAPQVVVPSAGSPQEAP
jgi:arsenate reductase